MSRAVELFREARQADDTTTVGGSGDQSKHPHGSAGSGHGGQFVKNNSGGGSKAKPAPKATAKPGAPQQHGVLPPPTTSRTMKLGQSGDDVRNLQYAMGLLGFQVPQDGTFDAHTQAAVAQAQQRLGIKPNGHASASLLRKMQDAVRLSPCVKESAMTGAVRLFQIARTAERFDPSQPRDDHGRWSLFADAIALLRKGGHDMAASHLEEAQVVSRRSGTPAERHAKYRHDVIDAERLRTEVARLDEQHNARLFPGSRMEDPENRRLNRAQAAQRRAELAPLESRIAAHEHFFGSHPPEEDHVGAAQSHVDALQGHQIDTGGRISREEAGRRMFGDAGMAKKTAPKAAKKTAPKAAKKAAKGAPKQEPPQGSTWETLEARQADVAKSVASPVVDRHQFGGFRGGTTRETHADGSVTIHKHFTDVPDATSLTAERQADAEELASSVAAAVGVRAPAVHRTGPTDIDMEFVPGEHIEHSPLTPWKEPPAALVKSDGGELLGLLDLILNNPERHAGNFLVAADGNPVALDHGSSFGRHASSGIGYFAGGFVDGNDWAAQNHMSADDMTQIRSRLESLRPEFDRLGRSAWWDTMMENFGVLESRAAGDRRRLNPDHPTIGNAPASPAAAKMARGKAAKAPFDVADVHTRLASAKTREEAHAMLQSASLADLKALAKTSGASTAGATSKDALRTRIVEHAVGFKLNSATIRGGTWDSAPVGHPDGLDSMQSHSLKSYGEEFLGPEARSMSDSEIKAALRAQGVGSPDVEHAKRLAEEPPKAPAAPSVPALSHDPAVRLVQVQNRIRAAYTAVLDRRGRYGENWVNFDALRKELGNDIPRNEVDDALIEMSYEVAEDPLGRRPTNIVPENNQKMLTQAQRDAALSIGNQHRHLIRIEDPSPRPVPSPSTPAPSHSPAVAKMARAKAAPAKRAVPVSITAGELSAMTTREQGHAAVASLSKTELVTMARELHIPRPATLKIADLRREIVDATIGRKVDSVATRGFTGLRP